MAAEKTITHTITRMVPTGMVEELEFGGAQKL